MNEFNFYIFDIDGTLTFYRDTVDPDKFLHGNFLFPILRDMMVEGGMDNSAAEKGILQLTRDVPFWDYTDIISKFQLPVREAFCRLRQWHKENLGVYSDTIAMVQEFYRQGKELFIVSNNPYSGCLMKLEQCGLADEFGSLYFRRILSTDTLRGCKGEPGVWQRALDRIPVEPDQICVVGDNPVEDGELPLKHGAGKTIIIPRGRILQGIEQNRNYK